MANTAVVKIDGIAELVHKLEDFKRNVSARIIKSALRAAAEVIAAEAKVLAPKDSGQLAESIAAVPLRNRGGQIRYGVMTGERFFVGDTFYGGFWEFGFKKLPTYIRNGRIYTISRASAHRAGIVGTQIPPRPFMRPAFDRKAADSLAVFQKQMKVEIEKRLRVRGRVGAAA